MHHSMEAKTLSLCLIVRDEEHNIPRLFESVRGCVDQIVMVDTGSKDQTVEVAKECAERIGIELKLGYHTWVNDFSVVRNHSFSLADGDYLFWLDADDVLRNQDNFIQWKKNAMHLADYWLANYNYALNPDGSPAVTFTRERIFNRKINPVWEYFIHEGVKPKGELRCNFISSWYVDHMRSEDDMKKDRSRNLQIIEDRIDELNPRLKFYYGKELYENQKTDKAFQVLLDVSCDPTLEAHDRVLAVQYACYSLMSETEKLKEEHQSENLSKVIQLAHNGLQLDANRAEFWNIIGESYIKQRKLREALPYFNAAKGCAFLKPGSKSPSPIFSFSPLYGEQPTISRAKIFWNLGDLENCQTEVNEALQKYPSDLAYSMDKELKEAQSFMDFDGDREDTEEIVFTCLNPLAYPFDEVIYEEKGMGGSETALIEVSRHLRNKTKKDVIIFQDRTEEMIAPSGVKYLPLRELKPYFSKHRPRMHVAWRHNVRVTAAPTYLWCHDLYTPTCEMVENFDRMFVLSEFHKNYVQGMQGINPEKLILTRNGLNPEKFEFEKKTKNKNKIVWMSSPDRGLERCIKVCDIIREQMPDIELHVYYGIEGLYKYGPKMSDLADKLKRMMEERPWVKYHGFTEQKKMYRDVSDAVLWLHPCDFIETFCITAIEMLALGVYPVTRKLGALANVLDRPSKMGQATLLEHDCITADEHLSYAMAAIDALKNQSWKGILFDNEAHSWGAIADEWIKLWEV